MAAKVQVRKSAKARANTRARAKKVKTIKQSKSQTVKEKFKAFKIFLAGERVYSNEKSAKELCEKSSFGELGEDKINYSLVEALYLFEKGKVKVFFGKKSLNTEEFQKKASELESNFYTKYLVFRDMRNRGYIVKTALKFGADFRVYDKGIKPGQDHAKWILYPVHENTILTWHEFAAKNRVAHSTRKHLLIAIVDNESDITYYEIAWRKP
ncbi:MAG: tRNA-intron lyase [Nanoarchaeota archaeon]|nr:tRNA-intron lyase [Nanoarchaeota archaeon]